MANPEHLAILKQGVEAWNAWRVANPDVNPDLIRAYLIRAYLSEAYLSRANLIGAYLSKANLIGAYLIGADLSMTNLIGADLNRADLNRANLIGADLSEVDLRRADLSGADLSRANLRGADLDGAYLRGANLRRADLSLADLSDADLDGANLSWADLSGADLNECTMIFTSIGGVDLSQVKGLETVIHLGPSNIGTDTLALTLRGSGGRFTDEQIVFFEGAGVPPILLEYLPGMLESNPIQFYSCFISYSTQDEDFATKLNEDLNTAGVRTWKWDMDAVPGRYLRENIDVAMRNHDKVILICSVNSLTSPAVDREIETALQKEERLGSAKAEREKEALLKGEMPPYVDTNVLVPIRLDDTVFNWTSSLAPQVKRYYIPDFSDTKSDSDTYRRELQRLIEALNPRKWPPIRTSLK